MRTKYEVSIRIKNGHEGFAVTVDVENKETHATASSTKTFAELPSDYESLIESVIAECEK